MRHAPMRCLLVALAVMAAASMPATAAEEKGRSPEALAKEGVTKLLDALQLLIDEIPQYAAPEVLPNGDIIIRRLDKEPKPEPEEREREEQPRSNEPEET